MKLFKSWNIELINDLQFFAYLLRETRHRASTSMYLLTFRVRVTSPLSMDEIERPCCT